MFVGNLMLLIMNIPLVGLFVQILRVKAGTIGAFAVCVTLLGAYTLSNRMFDLWVVLAFGLIGYLMKKAGFEPGPLVLGFILGQILETSFRQSLLISGGSLTIFVDRPVSAALLALSVVIIVAAVLKPLLTARKASSRGATQERDESVEAG